MDVAFGIQKIVVIKVHILKKYYITGEADGRHDGTTDGTVTTRRRQRGACVYGAGVYIERMTAWTCTVNVRPRGAGVYSERTTAWNRRVQ